MNRRAQAVLRMMSVDATCCISRKCNYIFHYIKKIVHNDFNNFCNTMNKEEKKKNKARAQSSSARNETTRERAHCMYSHRHEHSLLHSVPQFVWRPDIFFRPVRCPLCAIQCVNHVRYINLFAFPMYLR